MEYEFKHPLTQAVAQESQLGQRRARTHAAVARAIEEMSTASLDERAARLAQHWEEAGDAESAARWHGRAARWCAVDNPPDALRHYQRKRDLLKQLPDSREVRLLRLEAATEVLNGAWQHGLSEAEVTAVFEEGCELAIRIGDVRAHVLLLANRAGLSTFSGNPEAARTLVQEASARVRETSGSDLRAFVLAEAAQVHCFTGELEASVKVMGEAITLYEKGGIEFNPQGLPTAWNDGVLGLYLVYMGRLDEAADSLRRCERQGRELGHAQLLSFWHVASAQLCAHAGDPAGARSHGRLAVDEAEKVGSSATLILAYGYQGLGLAASGEWAASASRYELALDLVQRTRGLLLAADLLSGFARSQLGLGDLARARATAEEAVRTAIASGTPVFEANAQLALAEARLALDGDAARPEIEAALQRCSELIERTGARLYTPQVHEQRAALAELAGDRADAERQLREAHRLYTEMGATGHAERVASELGI